MPLVNKTKHYKRLSVQSTFIAGSKGIKAILSWVNGATLLQNLGLRDEPGATDSNMAKCKVADTDDCPVSEVKEDQQNALLFYRMGDFYEMFFEDAEIGANVPGITLTKQGKSDGDDIPMCGVPVHAVDGYLARLIRLATGLPFVNR